MECQARASHLMVPYGPQYIASMGGFKTLRQLHQHLLQQIVLDHVEPESSQRGVVACHAFFHCPIPTVDLTEEPNSRTPIWVCLKMVYTPHMLN